MCDNPTIIDDIIECTDTLCVELLTPSYSHIQVNIGRNIGTVPMGDSKWKLFQDSVSALITRAAITVGSPTIETHLGLGVWDGIPEDSAHISTTIQGDFDLNLIRVGLETLKRVYEQDSIALITSSELI